MLSPSLRLFTGADDSHLTTRERQQRYTLRQAFEEITRPRLLRRGRSAGTISKYRKACWYFEEVFSYNPPLCEITGEMLDSLPCVLLDPARRLAITTHTAANQQLMYVEAILRSCGPRMGRRGGAGILDDVPIGERLPAEAPTKRRRIIPEEAWNRLYLACGKLQKPAMWNLSIPFPLASRAMLVLLYTCGPRRTEAMTMRTSAVIRSSFHPDDEVDIENLHGWIAYHTPKTRAKKNGLPLVVPMSECLRRHLDAIDGVRTRLFPYSDHPTTWRKWLKRINTHAGIDPPYTFQDMRKTANRGIRRIAGREVAKFVLGHQPRGVNAQFYDDLTEDAVEAVNARPQPEMFLKGPEL